MLDEYAYIHRRKRRRARRWDVKAAVGPLLGGLALVYMITIALVGILAGT